MLSSGVICYHLGDRCYHLVLSSVVISGYMLSSGMGVLSSGKGDVII